MWTFEYSWMYSWILKSSVDSPHSSMLKELSNCLHWPRRQAKQHGRGVAKWRVGKWSASSETAATCHGGMWPCGQSWISCVDIDGTWFLQSRVFWKYQFSHLFRAAITHAQENDNILIQTFCENLLSWWPTFLDIFKFAGRCISNKATIAVWSTRAAKTILEEACNASPASVWNYQASVI